MQYQNDYFDTVRLFVPELYQNNAKSFMYYLRTLTEKRHDKSSTSLDVKKSGIEVIIYRPQYTPTEFFKWNDLEKLVKAYFQKEQPQQLQMLL